MWLKICQVYFYQGIQITPNSKIHINNEELDIDVNGNFNINIDIFKKDGGQKESERLGVPLLGKIPLSKEIMNATDSGIPYCRF